MSPQECEIPRYTHNQLEMKPDSPALAPEPSCVPHHTQQGFDFFRQLQRFPETPDSSLEEHQFQHSNSMIAPCTPNHLKMRADSVVSTEEVCKLSTNTSRGGFPQQYVCERDREFAASCGMDTEIL